MILDLSDTTFVCIDIQPRPRVVWTEANILDEYRRAGFTLGELNAAVCHFHDVMVPNAARVAGWARSHGLPRVFVHWSAQVVSPLGDQPRPHDALGVRADDRVLAKDRMDAFESSELAGVLRRIGRRTLLMVGGHTRGCLGRTARSAIRAGYRCVLVRDASYDASIRRWPAGIADVPYAAIIDTDQLLSGE